MPLVYRAMRAGEDNPLLPAIGGNARSLGVRATDIQEDQQGGVHPGMGGMSVAPTWRELPGFLIPRRLRSLCRKAAGPDNNRCWKMGQGAFAAAAVSPDLNLRPDPRKAEHGFVEPARVMPLEAYRAAIEATRAQWTIDEV